MLLILDAILLASIIICALIPLAILVSVLAVPCLFWYWYCWQQSIIIRRDRDEVHNCLIQ